MQKAIPILLLLLLAFPASASADTPAPARDYTQVSADGQYIFVMLADNASGYNEAGFVQEDEEIRSKYKQAGLYRNDGSTVPLWTIEWYSFNVELSSDGKHVVQYGPWASSNDYEALALAFYENGERLTSYRVDQLVANPSALPHSVSHYMWLKDATLNDRANSLSVETLNGERYVFDVATGEMVSGKVVDPMPGGLPVSANALVGLVLGLLSFPLGLIAAILLLR